MKIFICVICFVGIALLYGCGLFSARDAENPTTQAGNYIPPTSPSIVIDNLMNAFKEKNAENFVLCFADTNRGAKRAYQFESTPDYLAKYPTLFSSWNIVNERQSFVLLMAKLPLDEYPGITLDNTKFDVLSPDSAVFVSDYSLVVNHVVATSPTTASGVLRFTLIPDLSGLWAIQRWTDVNLVSSSTPTAPWSALKAEFSN